ncbi:hypothetical protein EA473_16260 [Natrarchaeobius chitinivorans]|uniref:Uncharacterized protein n=1 Tax=Natrarchaeobius chitinivorans TaxID=1679083 RepID=A0A3N6MAS8_NATCH|nr:hypothetical protein EA473_16260 [Natrarchaeobius chitinivorans]
MDLTINLKEDANVELGEADICVLGNSIEFSVEGEISGLSSELLTEFTDQQLSPVEITFERE